MAAAIGRNFRVQGLLLLGVAAAGLAASLAIGGWIVGPLRRLEHRADAWLRGGPAERGPVAGPEEVERLGGAFERMARGLSAEKRRAEEAQAHEAGERRKLEIVLRTLPVGVFVADATGRLLDANDEARRIWGGSAPLAAGFEGYREYRGWFVEGGAEVEPTGWPLARAIQRGEVVHGELVRIRRFDGSEAIVLHNAAPIRDARGAIVGGVVAIQDVTAAWEADRRKDEFLAVLSHELRNPLAPMRNALEILHRALPGGPQAQRARGVLERQVGHVTRLVDDLLDVTRIARGKLQVERVRVNLAEVVRRAAEDHRSLFDRQGVRFDVRVPDAEVPLEGDAVRLAQVVGNLLHNAAKFTPSGGRVELSLAAGDGAATLRVADTGAGLDPGMAERIFEPFVQGPQGLDRTHGGLGLGLALVKALVARHGGGVEARSDGPGRGTAVTLRLPLAAAAPPALRVVRQPEPSSCRVLVVEDNVDGAESLRELLEMEGHVVEVAHDGPGALAKARAFHPDVVLCDIGLPGMDGYAVARAIRADPVLARGRLVALTGYAAPEDRERTRDAGFDEHLAKPPTLDELRAAVAARCAAA
jgi:signal transduction histidine kinase/CheY-like chemotaxis protein/HAMP domain-containing protein